MGACLQSPMTGSRSSGGTYPFHSWCTLQPLFLDQHSEIALELLVKHIAVLREFLHAVAQGGGRIRALAIYCAVETIASIVLLLAAKRLAKISELVASATLRNGYDFHNLHP